MTFVIFDIRINVLVEGLRKASSAEVLRNYLRGIILHFDSLRWGTEEATKRTADQLDEYNWLKVALEELSRYIWLAPTKACTAEATVKRLVA